MGSAQRWPSVFLTVLLSSTACPGGLLVEEGHRELGTGLFPPKFCGAAAGLGELLVPSLWAESPLFLVVVGGLNPPEGCSPVCCGYSVRTDAPNPCLQPQQYQIWGNSP